MYPSDFILLLAAYGLLNTTGQKNSLFAPSVYHPYIAKILFLETSICGIYDRNFILFPLILLAFKNVFYLYLEKIPLNEHVVGSNKISASLVSLHGFVLL